MRQLRLWVRFVAIIGATVLIVLFYPRAPPEEFDTSYAQAARAADADLLIVGSCTAGVAFDEGRLKDRLNLDSHLVALGGGFSREWYLILAHSVFGAGVRPKLVVLPVVGAEILDNGDLARATWSERDVERLIDPSSPRDSAYEGALDRQSGRFGALRRRLEDAYGYESALDRLEYAALRWAVPSELIPAPHVRHRDAVRFSNEDNVLGRWRGLLNRQYFGPQSRRDGVALELKAPPPDAEAVVAALEANFMPLILDLVARHRSRLLVIRLDANASAPETLDPMFAALAAWLTEHGAYYADLHGAVARAPTAAAPIDDAYDRRGMLTHALADAVEKLLPPARTRATPP